MGRRFAEGNADADVRKGKPAAFFSQLLMELNRLAGCPHDVHGTEHASLRGVFQSPGALWDLP